MINEFSFEYYYNNHTEDSPYFYNIHGQSAGHATREVVFFRSCDSYYTEWHRLDGPAYIDYFEPPNSDTSCPIYRKLWFINDKNVTGILEDWAKDNNIDLDNLSDIDVALIKLTWAYYGQ